jgi:hypothetical protein
MLRYALLTPILSTVGAYFRFYDKDGSGCLYVGRGMFYCESDLTNFVIRDKKEFKSMCDHMMKNGYDLKRLNFSFETLDRDGDGQITFNEVRFPTLSARPIKDSPTKIVHHEDDRLGSIGCFRWQSASSRLMMMSMNEVTGN